MPKRVTIVDYGIGNIFSVTRAFQHCGAEVLLTDNPRDILEASSLVLPGVGAFSNGMDGLRQRSLIDPLQEYAASGRPMLGICLGMQMLFSESTEFGIHAGLNIIEGKIHPIHSQVIEGKHLKVPHIGWGVLQSAEEASWDNTILNRLDIGDSCYFVHSFMAVPDNPKYRLADTKYGSVNICATVAKGNIYGCQFHPEKSGLVGLNIIRGFLEI
ncbi:MULTISPECIES: imidazole glycerol phosphate synthase subunit HisH [Chromobacterium]|uniref:Imidazole glycerol phosphate synthase subunit HisH n=1 Tax=Chromobacterium rhizoryzae TaxID=1778675 RepID=A0AAD0RUW8_9NEIS|nr:MULTISPECIES: imidazole glycerol phosphate synthase subunit HisH [Chromobacterium]AXT48967.1 imidazole glycerol phosphate synthase subunit HisH [Chromobacterium rhizoryzae]PTU72288.1 imidazole glycerol phosphate synthase subunit HisH [Chromobacterium haemolyticum]QOD82914.1 imidazole glycerol phosphate synthase subunit HisH [Chromobacterium haemolyticum]